MSARRKSINAKEIDNGKKGQAKYLKEKRIRDEESINRAKNLDRLAKEGSKEIV